MASRPTDTDAAAHLNRAAQAARRGHMIISEGFHLAHLGVVLHQAGEQRLVAILNEARTDAKLDVQLFALDALDVDAPQRQHRRRCGSAGPR